MSIWPSGKTPAGGGQRLPTPEQVLANADHLLSRIYALAGDVGDELRSDVSQPWTAEQSARKRRMFEALDAVKREINETR